MYIPQQHLENDLNVIYGFIRKYNFGTLIYHCNQGLQAFHVPFILDQQGILKAHINRQNAELEAIVANQELLVIFSGPHGYISPAWYDRSTAPTWDFIKIHAYGYARFVEGEQMLDTLDALIKESENSIGNPWGYTSLKENLPPIYLEKMLPKIIGIEIPITRYECQVKMSQERTSKERMQIIQGLKTRSDPLSHQLIEYLEKYAVSNPHISI